MHAALLAALVALAAPKTGKPAAKPAKPTAADAKAFFDQVDQDLRRLWVARDRAAWVNENFITDDTEFLAAQGEEATAEYFTRTIPQATRFDGMTLSPDVARMRDIFKLQQIVPAPADPASECGGRRADRVGDPVAVGRRVGRVGDGDTGLGQPAGRFQRDLLGPAAGGRELGHDHDVHGMRLANIWRDDGGDRFTGDQPSVGTEFRSGSQRRNS